MNLWLIIQLTTTCLFNHLQTSTISDNSRMAILSNSVPKSGSIASQQQQQQQHKNPPDYSNSASVIHSQPYFSIFNHVPPPPSVSLNSISNNNNINSNTNNNNRVHFPKTSRRLPQVIEYLYFCVCVYVFSIMSFFVLPFLFDLTWQTSIDVCDINYIQLQNIHHQNITFHWISLYIIFFFFVQFRFLTLVLDYWCEEMWNASTVRDALFTPENTKGCRWSTFLRSWWELLERTGLV